MCLPDNQGVYCVVFHLVKPISQKIGKLDVGDFNSGYYLYCGSAKGRSGLKGRVQRHLRKEAVRFWHIDYLKPYLEPLMVWYVITRDREECDLVKALCVFEYIEYGMKGFGASDCKHQCKSHLLFAPLSTNLDDVFENLADGLAGINKCLV